MADNTPQDIVVRVRGDQTALIESLQAAGIKVQQFGGEVKEKAGLGREGMMMLSMSAQQAALSLGLPGPVARKLGGEIDNVISSFGKFATGIGLATIAIATAIAAYNKYTDYKKNQREELDRSVSGIRGEVMALYDSAGVSDKVRKATYDLTLAKRDLMRVEAALLLIAWNEQLKEQNKLLEQGGSNWEIFKRTQVAFWGGLGSFERIGRRFKEDTEEYINKQTAEIDVLEKKIALLEKVIERISGKAPTYEQTQYTDIDKQKDAISQEQARLKLWESMGIESAEFRMDKEMQIYQMQTDLMTAELVKRGAMKSEILAKQYTRDLGLQTLYAVKAQAIETNKWQTAEKVLGETGKLMDMFYSASGGKAKAFFYLSRGIAAAEAFMHYQAAAAKESKQDWGMNMATFYRGMSVAVPAAILAQTIQGTGGHDPGGAGSVSTSSPGVTEGLPASTERNQELHIYINGNEIDVPQTTERVVRELWRNNGNVGGLQVGISGNA